MENIRTYKDFLGELTVTYKRTEVPMAKVNSSKDAADFIRPYYEEAMDDHEQAMAIHLNNANYIVNVNFLSSGSETGTIIPVKSIVRQALQLPVAALILVHNHPSGATVFSQADIKVSARLKKACEYFDIKLLDSLLITRETYGSMSDQGLL